MNATIPNAVGGGDQAVGLVAQPLDRPARGGERLLLLAAEAVRDGAHERTLAVGPPSA